jgi:hypothetical protein
MSGPIPRGEGTTTSERYLATLGERAFLNLWSYPNAFIDKRARPGGEGKELCDLLVVFGDDIIIFSDKTIAWPASGDLTLSWQRWFRRAVEKSVDQIKGAERWIHEHPDRIFVDRACTIRLPLELPPPERMKVHRVVVALGAADACIGHFKGGSGSFRVASRIIGPAHVEPNSPQFEPFAIGDIDPAGSLVHVLNDATLDLVLGELDTVADFTRYLTCKERFLRSGRTVEADGEEDLLGEYLRRTRHDGRHDFVQADGSDLPEGQGIIFEPGNYADLLQHPQYMAKKAADEVSYVWDRLILNFTTHMLAGTSISDEQSTDLMTQEFGIRAMAAIDRFERRSNGEALLGAFQRAQGAPRFTRCFGPAPGSGDGLTGFFFLALAVPGGMGYEKYRHVRKDMLQVYALAFLERYRHYSKIVGVATEPPDAIGPGGSSEDLIYALAPDEWTGSVVERLEANKKRYNIMQPGSYQERPYQASEYPA